MLIGCNGGEMKSEFVRNNQMLTGLVLYMVFYMYLTRSNCFHQIVGDSLAFALGLATTLALLGIAASFAGKAYGQVGQGLPLAASGLAVIMGLNLLEVSSYCLACLTGGTFSP